MDKKLANLLLALDDEIERKCFAIKRKKVEKMLQRFFMTACFLFVTVPFLFIFAGVNLISLCIPVVLFLAVGLFTLTPFLLNNQLGGVRQ